MRSIIMQHFLMSLIERKKCRLLHHYPTFFLRGCELYPSECSYGDGLQTTHPLLHLNGRPIVPNDRQFEIIKYPHSLIGLVMAIER